MPITRGDRGSLRVYANQLLKLIHCTLTIDENIRDSSGRTGLHIRQALFAEEARLWWDDDTRGVGQGSSLVLSSVLFHSILDRSAPLSTHAIKQLRKSPMDLDVYAWLVHRLFSLSKPSTVDLAAALRAVRSRLRRDPQIPSLLHRLVEARADGLPRSEAQGRRRRRDSAALETAPGADQRRRLAPLISRQIPRRARRAGRLRRPAVTSLPLEARRTPAGHARNWAKNSDLRAASRRLPNRRVTSLPFQRQAIDLYEPRKGEGRAPGTHEPLHLYRSSVASVTRRPLHLSRQSVASLRRSAFFAFKNKHFQTPPVVFL